MRMSRTNFTGPHGDLAVPAAPVCRTARVARLRFRLVVAPVIALLVLPALARADALNVNELKAKIDVWKSKQADPPPVVFHVEGRAIPLGKDRVQFKKCDVKFILETDMPEFLHKPPNLEVSGQIVRDPGTGEYVFHVQTLREVPDDLERFLRLRRDIRSEPATRWYELGDWAKIRGTLYSDYELLARSEEAYARGIELERAALADDDPEGLLALADKAARYRLSSRVREEIVHEAFYRLWRKSRSDTKTLAPLLEKMTDWLPGSTDTNLARYVDIDLKKRYAENWKATYATSDSETRRRLHRMLYADVLLRTITLRLAPDSSNGIEIADEIGRLVPEERAFAESIRQKVLEARGAEVEKLPKAELLALADEYRQLQPERARSLIETWLAMRFRQLDADDTEGLLQLSEEYRRLLQRDDRADQILIEAWKRNPKATDIAERLTQRHYRRQGNDWLSEAEFNARPEGRLEQSIRQGRIEVGMTDSHVHRALGEPASIARVATAGRITEVWTYNQSGNSRMAVRFVRSRVSAELHVDAVAQTTRS